jgi:hypothetical protein
MGAQPEDTVKIHEAADIMKILLKYTKGHSMKLLKNTKCA